jgi:hypothetical protein
MTTIEEPICEPALSWWVILQPTSSVSHLWQSRGFSRINKVFFIKHLPLLVLPLLSLFVLSCIGQGQVTGQDNQPQSESQFLSVDGRCFVDTDGRQVILHDMIVISKSKKENYLSWHGPAEF